MFSLFNENMRLGVILSGLGASFMILGVILFFNSKLLIMGNLLFLTGLVVLMGLKASFAFFKNLKRIRGTICFFFGIFIVIYGYPKIGMIIQCFGFINLFGNFFPIFLSWLQHYTLFRAEWITSIRRYFTKPIIPE